MKNSRPVFLKLSSLLSLLLLFFIVGCAQEARLETLKATCENTCEDETLLEALEDVPAKIIRVCTGKDDAGNAIDCVFAISTDEASLDKETWPINDKILVPCTELPEEFQQANMRITLSGLKMSCCNLLTMPEIWGGFGCKFEVTSIEPAD